MSVCDLTTIKAIYIFSQTGERITAQYYDNFIKEEARPEFQNSVWTRVSEFFDGQVMQHEEYIVVYRKVDEIVICLVGDLKSNELLLDELMGTIIDALRLVYKKLTPESVTQQIDLLYLVLDETFDQGRIFEGDPETVAARALLKDDKAFAGRIEKIID